TNTYTGSTVAAAGTIILAPTVSISASKAIDVRLGAILDATAVSGGWALANNQSLSGAGTVLGSVIAQSGAQIAPGTNQVAGTLTLLNSLSLSNGSKLNFDLANVTVPGGGTNDLLAITGDLALSGTVLVDFHFLSGFPSSPDAYTLITYAGTLSGGASNLVAVNYTNRYAFSFDDSLPGQIRVF